MGKDLYIEKLNVQKIFELFNNEGSEINFIKYNIVAEGIEDFNVLVLSDSTLEERKEHVKSILGIWGKK